MTPEHFEAILKAAHAKQDKEGWTVLGDGGTLTLYLAHESATLTISRVESLRVEGELVYARNVKREMFGISRSDVFAIGVEGATATGQPARRAGFG